MGFHVGTSASTTLTGATLTTPAVATSNGDLVWMVMGGIINTTHTASDSVPNTWTQNFNPVTNNGVAFVSSSYAKNITGNASHTFTMTSGNSSDIIALAVIVWTGADTSAPADQHNENSYTSTTSPTSNATPTTTQADEVIFGGLVDDGNSADTYVAGTGFTLPAACKQARLVNSLLACRATSLF